MRTKLTENFSLEEFACPEMGNPTGEELENIKFLATQLQIIRGALGRPLTIISGWRSPTYNKKIGGAKESQHMQGRAADLKSPGVSPAELHMLVLKLIKEGKLHQGGVGKYSTFVHYDTRGTAARWSGN
jgi:uncharacterized protein YcbK (DUF882 family)